MSDISTIDTGDVVLHAPTGEQWIVARVDGGRLSWLGWPPGWADLTDCTLAKKANSEQRQQVLRDLASSGHHCSDWAKAQIGGAA